MSVYFQRGLRALVGFIRTYRMIIILIVLIIIGIFVSDSFTKRDNIINTLRQASLLGIVSLGVSFVIISGCFDLSTGSVVSITGVLAMYLQPIIGVGWACIIAFAVGMLVGVINGSVIALVKGGPGDAFMITFGMQSVLQAFALIVTQGHILPGSKSNIYNYIGNGALGDIPFPLLLFFAIALILNIFLKRTKTGRSVYYTGTNVTAARLSGINVEKVRVIVYVFAAFFATVVAIIITARINSATATIGEGYELDALTAIVVGGISLEGGKGTLINTVIGAFIIVVLSNILFLLGVKPEDQMIAKGIIIVLAVCVEKRQIIGKKMKVAGKTI